MDRQIYSLIGVVEELDLMADCRALSDEKVVSRSKFISDLWALLRAKDSLLNQRSKSRWLKAGDANSGFFHASIKSRS